MDKLTRKRRSQDVVGRVFTCSGRFFARHDPHRETGWIAMQHDQPSGAIFCVAGPHDAAKLRLFLVEPAARGTGLAQIMRDTCIARPLPRHAPVDA